jgi:hypothetical protein
MGELIMIGMGETKKIDLTNTTPEQVMQDLTNNK